MSPEYAAVQAEFKAFEAGTTNWLASVPKKRDLTIDYNDAYGQGKLHATYVPNPTPTKKTMIVVHGYLASGVESALWGKLAADLGYNLLLPDQRSHGQSSGDYVDFGYYARYDLVKWVKAVDRLNGPDSAVVLYGNSMGSGAITQAAGMADLPRSVKGIVAEAGFADVRELFTNYTDNLITYLRELGQSWGLLAPVYQFGLSKLLEVFDTQKLLNVISTLVRQHEGMALEAISPKATLAAERPELSMLFIDTEDDSLIPYEHTVTNYQAAAAQDKKLWLLPGTLGGHTSAIQDYRLFKRQMQQFTTRVMAGKVMSRDGLRFQELFAQAQTVNRNLFTNAQLATRDAALRQVQTDSLAAQPDYPALIARLQTMRRTDPVAPMRLSAPVALTNATRFAALSKGDLGTVQVGDYSTFYVDAPVAGDYELTFDFQTRDLITIPGTVLDNSLTLNQIKTVYGKNTPTPLARFDLPQTFQQKAQMKKTIHLAKGRAVLQLASQTDKLWLNNVTLRPAPADRAVRLPATPQGTVSFAAASFSAAADGGYFALQGDKIGYTGRSGGQFQYTLAAAPAGSYTVQFQYATPNLNAKLRLALVDATQQVIATTEVQASQNNWFGLFDRITTSPAAKLTITDPARVKYLRVINQGDSLVLGQFTITHD
nr:alpha/beta fold hydrolase [Lacticaseibacillus absianus]